MNCLSQKIPNICNRMYSFHILSFLSSRFCKAEILGPWSLPICERLLSYVSTLFLRLSFFTIALPCFFLQIHSIFLLCNHLFLMSYLFEECILGSSLFILCYTSILNQMFCAFSCFTPLPGNIKVLENKEHMVFHTPRALWSIRLIAFAQWIFLVITGSILTL